LIGWIWMGADDIDSLLSVFIQISVKLCQNCIASWTATLLITIWKCKLKIPCNFVIKTEVCHIYSTLQKESRSSFRLKARTHLQTLSANSLQTSFVRVCKQSANKYSVFLVSRWRWNVFKCGRPQHQRCATLSQRPSVGAKWSARLLLIREVLGLNLGLESGYYD
jgi:hypothetical protein